MTEESIIALLSALVGGIAAALTAFQIYKIQHKAQVTQKYIDEFLSDAMLHHRIAASQLRERLRNHAALPPGDDDPFSIERLARGFWNAGPEVPYDYYKGPTDHHTGLNEHQSLEAILQYISRLIMNIEKNYIDVNDFKSAVHGSFVWLDDLLFPLEMEIKKQTEKHRKEGGVVKAIDRINKLQKLRDLLDLGRPRLD